MAVFGFTERGFAPCIHGGCAARGDAMRLPRDRAPPAAPHVSSESL